MKNLTLEKDKIKVSNNYFSLFNNKNSNERQQTKKDTIRNVPSFKSKKNINLPFKTSLQGGQSDSKKNVRKTFFRQSTFVNKNTNNDIEEEDLIKETKLEKLQKKTAELEEELKTKQQIIIKQVLLKNFMKIFLIISYLELLLLRSFIILIKIIINLKKKLMNLLKLIVM